MLGAVGDLDAAPGQIDQGSRAAAHIDRVPVEQPTADRPDRQSTTGADNLRFAFDFSHECQYVLRRNLLGKL